jgi:O-antigen/teichoic acid export membrane protein
MLAALAWTGVISGVLVGLMNGMSRFDAVARAAMVGAAIVIGGAAVASLLNMADVALFALVLGQLALIVLIAPVVRKSTVSSELGSWRQVKCLSAFQDLFGTIIPVFLTSLIWMFAMWWGGKRVLAEEGGDIQFAYYAIGLHWFSAILFLPGALNNALLPRLFGASAATYREGREPLRAMAFKGAATAALIAIMAALCVLALNAMGMLASGYAVESHMLTPVIVVFMQAAVLASAAAILGNAVIAARGAHVWLIGITLYAVIFHVMPTLLKWEISAVGISRALSVAYLVLAIYGVTAMMACTHKSGCIKGA